MDNKEDVIAALIGKANEQLAAQGNKPGGAAKPEEPPQGLFANVPMSEMMPFGAGATPQGDPTMLSNMVSALMTLPKRAIDASKADVAHYNEGGLDQTSQTVGPATETAMALMGTGAPAAEAGAAGIFGGKLARRANLPDMEEARYMANMGEHGPEDILSMTGWSRNPADQKWRFEIPDNRMKMSYMPMNEGDTAIGQVGTLVKHPDLFANYPQLQNIPVRLTKDSRFPTGSGMYSQQGIHVSAPNADVARSVMAHELQHGVQGIEGFSWGADPSHYGALIEKGLRKNPSLLNEGHTFSDVLNAADKLYHRTAGEVEARNVQTRLDWDPAKRLLQGPWASQDVPYSAQITHDPYTGMVEALKRK